MNTRSSHNFAGAHRRTASHPGGGQAASIETPGDQAGRSLSSEIQLTPWGRREAVRRQLLLAVFDALVASGRTQQSASRQLSVAVVSIWRWRKRAYPLTCRCGRKPKRSKRSPLGIAARALLTKVLAIRAYAGEGNEAAWRAIAADPDCPPAFADFLRATETLPPALLASTKIGGEQYRSKIVIE